MRRGGRNMWRVRVLQYVLDTFTILSLTPYLNHNFLKLRLTLNSSKFLTGSGLVKPSAIWFLEGIKRISSFFFNTHSLTKWKSISMCFALAWNTGFADKYVAPRLSHHRHGLCVVLTPSSSSKDLTHITSAVAFATDLYSASVLDLETVACFLAL